MNLGDGPVGVLGEADLAAPVREVANETNRESVGGDLETVLGQDPAVLVITGRRGLAPLLANPPNIPVLPVGIPETTAAEVSGVRAAVRSALGGQGSIQQASILSVETGGQTVRALYDLTLMTVEPARISEYRAVATDGTPITHLRADGIVVATPLGSDGFAHRTGGPLLGRTLDGVAVVPVSPFSVARDCHVVEPPLSVSVERDEGAVELIADGRRQLEVQKDDPITIAVDGSLRVVSTDEKT